MPKTDCQSTEALHTAFAAAQSYLTNLNQAPVAAAVDIDTLRNRLGRELTAQGLPPEQVVAELLEDVTGGIVGCAGGRFFAWVVGGSLESALAADWLTTAWDQNAALYASAPAAAVVEEVSGGWLKEILGLPEPASFAFVNGCQMAHVTCLAAARHEVLAKQSWDVERQGLSGAPRIRILTGQRHGSVDRAVRLLGMGTSQIVGVATDALGRVQAEALRRELESDSVSPTIVVLQAGEINTGSFDDFNVLIPIAKSRGAWVHVDGAFGLWAAASPKYKHLTKGLVAADSWATDGHKWLNVPYDCGYAFVAHPEAHQAAMSHRAAYLTFNAGARDAMDWNPEWSRRARGFPTYAALRELGREGVSSLIERCCAHARSLVMRIGQLPGAQVMSEAIINQGLVRFLDPSAAATEADHTKRTNDVIAAVVANGEAFFSGSDWDGHRVMRVSVCNWRTSEEDVDRSVAAVAKVLGLKARA